MPKNIKTGSSISKRGMSSSKKKSISKTTAIVKNTSKGTHFSRAKVLFATMIRDQIEREKLSKQMKQTFLEYEISKEKITALEELQSLDKLGIQKVLRFLRDLNRRITRVKTLAYTELSDYYEDLEYTSPRASNKYIRATIIENIEHYNRAQDKALDSLMERFPKAWDYAIGLGYKEVTVHELTPIKTETEKLKEEEDKFIKEQEEIFASLAGTY